MIPSKHYQKVLFSIVVFNLIATWLHYTDNALFLSQYPGPDWFTPTLIMGTVTIMTPIGIMGYRLYLRRSFLFSYLLLGLYSITSISSPGHYLAPILIPMSLKMHTLIWMDGISGLLLIGFILWSSGIVQQWRFGKD